MSGLKRYEHPQIIDHLASHYVMGVLNPRVKRRVEQLRNKNAELDQAIYQWQDRMMKTLPVNHPSKAPDIWPQLEQRLFAETEKVTDSAAESFWSRLWQQLFSGVGATFAALLVVVSVLTYNLGIHSVVLPATSYDYLAVMKKPDNQVQMLFTAKAGATPGEATAALQWKIKGLDKQQAELWSIATNGERQRLGTIAAIEAQQHLSSVQWQVIKDSAFLEIILDGKLVARGECLNLQG